MARGGSRSVLEGTGDPNGEMFRDGRVGRAFQAFATDYFSPFQKPPGPLPRIKPQASSARYVSQGIDPRNPPRSPAQFAQLRRDVGRTLFLTSSPLAGLAYGIASLTNASPAARDAALALGGLFDAATIGAAPRGAPMRGRPIAPQATPVAPPFDLPPIRYRELTSSGDAQGINAILVAPLVPTRKRVPRGLRPTGLQPPETKFWDARGHLAGDQFGGSRDDPRNFMALTQTPANSPWMRDFENLVAQRVRNGEVVDYSVTPFGLEGFPPEWILMTASSLGRDPAARLVANPARPRR